MQNKIEHNKIEHIYDNQKNILRVNLPDGSWTIFRYKRNYEIFRGCSDGSWEFRDYNQHHKVSMLTRSDGTYEKWEYDKFGREKKLETEDIIVFFTISKNGECDSKTIKKER